MLSRTMAFLFGVFALQQFPSLPDWPWLVSAIIPLFVSAYWPASRTWSLPLLAFVFGLIWAALHAQFQLRHSLSAELEGQDLLLIGTVRSLPQIDARRVRFEFIPRQASLAGEAIRLTTPLRLNWYGAYPSELAPGQDWQLLVRLKRPWGMMNPGGFDYEGWLYQGGLGATGYVRQSADNQLLDEFGAWMPVQRVRHPLQQRLLQVLDGHPAQGIIMALAIGERGQMDDEHWRVLIATGTNHLMAISGLHVGLVAGFAFFLFSFLWRRCPGCCLRLAAPRAAAIAAFLVALWYAALAGFAIPTQRALLMLAVVLGAVFWMRPLAAGRALALALWLVLLWQPTAVLAAGFWLSFAAVALILYGMHARVQASGLWWRWGRVQWLVSVGLLPLLVLFFGKGSLSAPLANLLAVPWVSLVVVPLTLIGTALLPVFEPLGQGILQVAAGAFQVGWPLLRWLADTVPMLALSLKGWPLLLAGLGLAWLLAPRGWPLRPLGLVLCLPLVLLRPPVPGDGELWLTQLDVGQGLATVIQTRHHSMVFDTGPAFASGFNTGDAVLLPYLQHRGIRRLDKLVISHSDNDHLGGAAALLAGMPVAQVYSGESRRMDWLPHQACSQGHHWEWDGVVFRFLYPDRPLHRRTGNDDSCVLHIQAGAHAVLLTGDIEAATERRLLNSTEHLSADVLIAPHHGSASSSTEAFITAVSPRWVIFSAGYRNRYGHPHPAVQARYAAHGVQGLETWREGAIRLELGGNTLAVQRYRQTARRYWHTQP